MCYFITGIKIKIRTMKDKNNLSKLNYLFLLNKFIVQLKEFKLLNKLNIPGIISFYIYLLIVFISTSYSQNTTVILIPGKTYSQKLEKGVRQEFKINLNKGEFCSMTVMQLETDIVADLLNPTLKLIRSFDSPNGNNGPEYIEFSADERGTYRLQIYPLNDYSGMTEAEKVQYIEQNQGNYEIDSITVLSKEEYGKLLAKEESRKKKFIEYLNFGFEKTKPEKIPDNWYQNKKSTIVLKADTLEKHSGKNSVMLERHNEEEQYPYILHNIPANYDGFEIEVKAYIKMKNVENGQIGLLLRLDGGAEELEFVNMQQKDIHGTADWTLYSVKLPYRTATRNICVGVLLMGTGQLWADDFQVLLDGKDISEFKYSEPKRYKADSDREFNAGSKITSIELSETATGNLTILGKVWGFLKYYHPAIVAGEYNWDYELFRILPKILYAVTPEERNNVLSDWISSLGKTEQETVKVNDVREIKISPDLSWINDSSLGDKLTAQLNTIKASKRTNENYYIGLVPGIGNPDFKNERSYSTFSFPDAGFRLLSLYRYWNIIEYYFPSKYLTGENWNDILKEYIPEFVNASDEQQYKLAALSLIARIHDTHAGIGGDAGLEKYKGMYFAPVEITFVENKALVTGYYDEELGVKSGLKKGDIIESLNNKTVEEIIEERSQFYPASNYPTQLRNMAMNLLRTNDTILNINYSRGEESLSSQIECFPSDRMKIYKKYQRKDTCFKMINPDIAYLYPGTIKNANLPEIMPEILKTKGLIIDMRCYPSEFIVFTLSQYLQPDFASFVKFSKGNIITPGLFTMTPAIRVGGKNENYYKGKIVIIVNEETQSQAEYTTMALRTAPKATVIGSTTAGADGDVSEVVLPGGFKTLISGLGVYYPDGKETQRIGIVPDIEIKPTIEGVTKGNDEPLEKAISIINGN
jgi:hypothetical protein